MGETPGFIGQTAAVLFWVSWLVLFYLAWPRLVRIGRNTLRKRSIGKPVRLTIPPLRPTWDLVFENGLSLATRLFLGLSIVELFFRRLQFERFSLPIFGLCFGLTMLVRGWRKYFRPNLQRSEILFPHVLDNTAIGMRLLKAQDRLAELRHVAAELARKDGAYAKIATQLLEFVESVRVFLVEIRWEPFDSTVLRQAQPLFIRLEPLMHSFELLVRLTDEAELRKVYAELIEVLSKAKGSFEALQVAQDLKLLNQLDSLIAVLRHLYRPAP